MATVYIISDRNQKVEYIGRSKHDSEDRAYESAVEKIKNRNLMSGDIRIIRTSANDFAKMLERGLIRHLRPRCNSHLKH